MADLLTVEHFAPRVGEVFTLRVDEGEQLALELVETRALGDAFGAREAFALLFRGPAEPAIDQATYRVANDHLGELEIFIVPVARRDETADYEAIFT